jgi:hypothetical protein
MERPMTSFVQKIKLEMTTEPHIVYLSKPNKPKLSRTYSDSGEAKHYDSKHSIEKGMCGMYYHYSNAESQGALVIQTSDFPDSYNKRYQEYECAYSDRLMQWDYERFQKTCEFVGTGDQGWCQKLESYDHIKLRQFAQIALGLFELPEHVRIVHHYNVSNGASCPTIEAIWDKPKKAKKSTNV